MPILPNVETHICAEPDGLAYTLDHLHELVVKPVGGVRRLRHASSARMPARPTWTSSATGSGTIPSNYISQPMVKLSVCPTLCDEASTHGMSICGRSR